MEGNLTVDSDLLVKGDFTVQGNLHADSDIYAFGHRFEDTTRFTVKNAAGSVIISGHLLQEDSDMPTPGNNSFN